MKKTLPLLLALLFLFASALYAEVDQQTMDITTVTGKIYRDATVERLTPSGVDIGYLNADGEYAMVGIPLSQLTPELQKKFNYDPAAAKNFDDRVRKAAATNLEKAAESEAQRLARVTGEIKARLSGEDIQIKSSDLRFAIYAGRRAVSVRPVEAVRAGTIVRVVKDLSEREPLPSLILIDGRDLTDGEGGGAWSGFIYPTGVKARYKNDPKVPVFCDSLDDALALLERYLDIYSEFAANRKTEDDEKEKSAADAQQQAPDLAGTGEQQAADNSSGLGDQSGIDYKGGNVPNNGYLWGPDNYWGFDYYIGGSYYPVYRWCNRRHWDDWWRPDYRPRPPRPPRPPHPPRPPRPPRPEPGPGPGPGPRPEPPPRPRPEPPKPEPPPRPRPEPRPPTGFSPGPKVEVERNGGFRRAVPSQPRIVPPGPFSRGGRF